VGGFGSVKKNSNDGVRRSFNGESGRGNTASADDPDNDSDSNDFALTALSTPLPELPAE
jgi:hypothetical protein